MYKFGSFDYTKLRANNNCMAFTSEYFRVTLQFIQQIVNTIISAYD